MAAHTSTQRHERVRSATWPPSPQKPHHPQPTHRSPSVQPPQLTPPTITITPPEEDAFLDDLSEHPERHFLSPMDADDSWDSDPEDSDFDDSDGEWSAGITDFALFSADRRRAAETGQPLDKEWNGFVQGQGEAFARCVERVRLDEEGVPGLTPDASPDLRDDFDLDDDETEIGAEGEGDKLIIPWIQVPDYLTVEIKPSHSTGALISPDDDLPLFLGPSRKLQRKVERPGLRHARTLSGKRHVWRKPGSEMFTVGEDVVGEEEAERGDGVRVGRRE